MNVLISKHLLVSILGIALLAPLAAVPAHAQFTGVQNRGQRMNPARELYERGYREGLQRGAEDARRNRGFDLGRYPNYGGRDDFRRGFAEGYAAGFGRFSRQPRVYGNQRDTVRRGPTGYGAYGSYGEPAAARGFSDGYEEGMKDGRDRDRYDPVGSRGYRDGDNGYFKNYGSRDAYKNNYRAGFRQGYEEGYRDGTRLRR